MVALVAGMAACVIMIAKCKATLQTQPKVREFLVGNRLSGFLRGAGAAAPG
jgi:hypothetical protein